MADDKRQVDLPPDDFTLDVRRWLGDRDYPDGGIYPNALNEEFDDRAAAVWVDGTRGFIGMWATGFAAEAATPQDRLTLIKHELFRRIMEVKNGGAAPGPEPPPVPSPLPVPPSGSRVLLPISGQLELIDGGRGGLRDRHGRRVFTGVHGGDLLSRYYRNPDYVRRQLDYFAAIGQQFVRTWTVLPGSWWAARTGNITPEMSGYWDALRNYARELVMRGLRWQVSQGDTAAHYTAQDARRGYMTKLGRALRDEGGTERLVISIDGGNEAWKNGEPDPVKLADMLDYFLRELPVPIVALTSVGDEGELNRYSMKPATVIAYHQTRFRYRHALERAWTAGYADYANATDPKAHPFLIDDEPAGVNNRDEDDQGPGTHVSALQDPSEWRDVEAMGMNAAVHFMGPQLYTLMTSPGVISDEEFSAYPAIANAPQLAAILPCDVQSWKQFHGGDGRDFSSLRVVGVSGNDTRCEHSMNMQSGEVVVGIYADEPGHHDLPVIRNFEGIIVNPGTLEKHPLKLKAGTKLPIDFNRGRVLIGKVS